MSRHHLAFCHPGTPFYDLAPAETDRVTFHALTRPLPPGWELRPGPEWTNVVPQDVPLVGQGWKIHVSTRPEIAEEVLALTMAHCLAEGLHFKVLSGPHVLRRRNAKDANRAGSGKFVTIYPPDDDALERTLRTLGTALAGRTGPYILSDLRWGDGPLYVRYGAFISEIVEDERGRVLHCIRDPDGNLVEDRRTPFFRPPEWAPIPDVLQEALHARRQGVLSDFPFTVERALHFSNGGGVYRAVHTPTGKAVLLKEARPLAGLDESGRDAVERQHRELWALEQLAGVPAIPPLVRHIRGHEHQFLAREFVEGVSLLEWVGRTHPLLHGRTDASSSGDYARRAAALVDQVEASIEQMHERGVVFGDLHPGNILVDDTDTVALIDLETATAVAESATQAFAAPGFRAPPGSSGTTLDRYALGCLRLAVFLPESPLAVEWSPAALAAVLEHIRDRFPLPDDYERAVRRDLGRADEEPARTPVRTPVPGAPHAPSLRDTDATGWPVMRDRIARWITAHATPWRTDRLFPGDAVQFTHPDAGLGLAHGAAGVLLALHGAGAEISTTHRDWLVDRTRRTPLLRPGLHEGLAGIAVALDRLGATDAAGDLLDRLSAAAERTSDRRLWSGLAGMGLAAATLASSTDGPDTTALATEIGLRLLDVPPETPARQETGLLAGPSGEAAFLVALHDLTGEARWLEAARSAVLLDVDRTGRSRPDGAPPPSPTPAEAGGTAMAARLVLERGVVDDDLAAFCATVAARARNSIRVVPGLLRGRAGELLVASTLHPGETSDALARHLPALDLALVRGPEGDGFLGEAMLRLSCDLATGAAGVLAVLDRLWGTGEKHPVPLHLFGTGTTSSPARS